MARKKTDTQYDEREAKQRFETALRGSRIVGANPPKTVVVKRGRRTRKDDPMPESDPEALLEWTKRNVQGD